MKDIDEIRRENLATLVGELGSVTALAKRAGRSDSQISQLLNGSANSKTGKPRGMRKETARMLESAAGKPAGWLDVDHAYPEAVPVARLAVAESSLIAACDEYRAAPPETRAAVDLLLLPRARRARVLAHAPQALTAVQLLEQHAQAAMALKKSA